MRCSGDDMLAAMGGAGAGAGMGSMSVAEEAAAVRDRIARLEKQVAQTGGVMQQYRAKLMQMERYVQAAMLRWQQAQVTATVLQQRVPAGADESAVLLLRNECAGIIEREARSLQVRGRGGAVARPPSACSECAARGDRPTRLLWRLCTLCVT